MTTSINTILKNRKNRKNKKGFSLVELIVVLVIMAILAAALVPTLIGYINQTRQSNAKNECASVVSAAQMIVSSAYADPNGIYTNQSDKSTINLKSNEDIADAAAALAEVDHTMTDCTVTYDLSAGKVTEVVYTDSRNVQVTYTGDNTAADGTYTAAKYEITN